MIVPEKAMERIMDVLASNRFTGSVLLFGSRAREECRFNSDIDLAVFGEVSTRLVNDLKEAGGLYKVDVVVMSELNNAPLREEIERDGVCIYSSSFDVSDEIGAASF